MHGDLVIGFVSTLDSGLWTLGRRFFGLVCSFTVEWLVTGIVVRPGEEREEEERETREPWPSTDSINASNARID